MLLRPNDPEAEIEVHAPGDTVALESLQKFASIHSSVYNHSNLEMHLYYRTNFNAGRDTALRE